MSENESVESVDTQFQTPTATQEEEQHSELDPPRPEPDIGASPDLGPVTRSGRKRKNLAPVKSAGKKKNKMISRSPNNKSDQPTPPISNPPAQRPADDGAKQPQQDLASLLTTGLGNIQASMGAMEARLAGKMDSLEASVNKNKETIMVLTNSVNKNTVDLARLESELRATDQSIDRRFAELVRDQQASLVRSSLDLALPVSSSSRSSAQENIYWKCRRSLRLWPVAGPDLVAATRRFLLSHLDLDLESMGPEAGDIQVRRVVEPRSKIRDEVVVEFCSSSLRDSIKGSGYKLEGKEAGIRMEVPVHLRSDFYVLQNMSYHLKTNNPGMKRSVKFDDSCHGLILDVQMPDEDWQRIRPDQARQAGKSDPSLRAGPREMSGDMIAGAARPHRSLQAPSRNPGQSRTTASGGNSEPLGSRLS